MIAAPARRIRRSRAGAPAARRAAAVAVLVGAARHDRSRRSCPSCGWRSPASSRPSLDRTGWDLHGPALIGLGDPRRRPAPRRRPRRRPRPPRSSRSPGLVLLGIVLLGDLPDVDDTGLVGGRLVEGTLRAGAGAYAEALAGVLVLLGGGVLVALRD